MTGTERETLRLLRAGDVPQNARRKMIPDHLISPFLNNGWMTAETQFIKSGIAVAKVKVWRITPAGLEALRSP
jgi:hypothetical protein